MTRITRFSDAFWDKEFCGTSGYEALSKKLKDGKAMGKELHDFLKARARLEEEYAKGLQRLIRSQQWNSTDVGTFKLGLDSYISETEKVATNHQEAANAFNDSAKRVSSFVDTQRTKVKQAKDTMDKATRKKLDVYHKAVQAKSAYEGKCKDLEKAEQQAAQMRHAGSATPKEMEKMYNRQAKSKTDKEKSDTFYKACIDTLDQQRQHWEKEMKTFCDLCQETEEERIRFMRNELWANVNITSQTYMDNDERNEEIRVMLERCDIDEDMITFIQEKKTGLERPGIDLRSPKPYEPYGGGHPVVSRPAMVEHGGDETSPHYNTLFVHPSDDDAYSEIPFHQ